MRLSNRSRKPLYSFIYSLVGIIFILGLIGFVLEINKFNVLGKKAWILVVIPLLLYLLLYLFGKPIFEYDSDGETLTFRNNHIRYIFFKENKKDEFPKYKLLKYNVINFYIFKRLYIYVSSKKNKVIVLKYDVTYLRKNELKDLIFSLNKVVRSNKEIYQEDNKD